MTPRAWLRPLLAVVTCVCACASSTARPSPARGPDGPSSSAASVASAPATGSLAPRSSVTAAPCASGSAAASASVVADEPTTLRWSIEDRSTRGVDPGSGVTRIEVITKTETAGSIRERTDAYSPRAFSNPKAPARPLFSSERLPPSLPGRGRDVGVMIARLMREHPHSGRGVVALGPYSLGPSGPVEGFFRREITIEVEGKVWSVETSFGVDVPAAPAWLAPLAIGP